MFSHTCSATTFIVFVALLSSVQALPRAHEASDIAAATPTTTPRFTFSPETSTPAPVPTSHSTLLIGTGTPSPVAPTPSIGPSQPVVPANDTKLVYRIDICNTENKCAEIKLIPNDCRLLRTPLDPELKNITVYKPAVCILTATTNCSMYGNLGGSDPSLFTGLQVDWKEGGGEKNAVPNVGAVFRWGVESVVCGGREVDLGDFRG